MSACCLMIESASVDGAVAMGDFIVLESSRHEKNKLCGKPATSVEIGALGSTAFSTQRDRWKSAVSSKIVIPQGVRSARSHQRASSPEGPCVSVLGPYSQNIPIAESRTRRN